MTMKSYLDQLKAEAEAVNLRSEEAKFKNQHLDNRILCDIPLIVQIEAFMRRLSPTQRNRA